MWLVVCWIRLRAISVKAVTFKTLTWDMYGTEETLTISFRKNNIRVYGHVREHVRHRSDKGLGPAGTGSKATPDQRRVGILPILPLRPQCWA